MKFNRLMMTAVLIVVLGTALSAGRLAPSPARAGASAQLLLPDLTIDSDALSQSIRFDTERFTAGDCAVVEGCVSGTGRRRLLRFSVLTPNIGTADLFMGDPAGNPLFVFSECHGHYHLDGYATYELLNESGTTVVTGRKQAFCLLDSIKIDPAAGPAKYDCGFQGISMGWADVYSNDLDCQWLDITGVPAGQYQLLVTLNPEGVLDELNFENNTATVPVRIPRVILR